MIDIIKQTPREYSAQSRDYQVLARLYSALFNISKMYIDNMRIWNNDIDNKLTTLRSKTLNFDTLRSWDENDLEAVTSCFKYLMRRKGTMKVLEYCVNILMKIQGIIGEAINEPIVIKNYVITVRVPENLLTLGVLEDLLEYLLPSGFIFNIVKYKSISVSDLLKTEIVYEDGELKAKQEPYSDKMYISSDFEKIIKTDEKYIQLSDSDKYWLRLEKGTYVPDDNLSQGLDSATLITAKENEIDLEKGKQPSDTVEIVVPSVEKYAHTYITDTFIYDKHDYKDVYEENWEDEV